MSTDLTLALITGLLGGAGHCLGMCGPLVAAINLPSPAASGPTRRLLVNALYNIGRVITYGFIGFLMGLTGSFANTAGALVGLQGVMGILAGALMILMGLGLAGSFAWTRRLEGALMERVLSAVRRVLEGRGPGRFFALGLLLGFLPCGLSYSAFAGAAATGHPVKGALYALTFGAATIPALLVLGVAIHNFGQRARGLLLRLGGLAVAAAGVVFVVRSVRFYVGV